LIFLFALQRGPFFGRTQPIAKAVPGSEKICNTLFIKNNKHILSICCECRKRDKQEINVWNGAIGVPGALAGKSMNKAPLHRRSIAYEGRGNGTC
jgi:hypothetical protein